MATVSVDTRLSITPELAAVKNICYVGTEVAGTAKYFLAFFFI
jgi:hypothetical protein